MDLESTLVRAESLFKRFQRTVEMIDKKGNFPSAPQARQRKLQAALVSGPGSPPSSSTAQPEASSSVGEEGDVKVISSELRALLSRKIEKVDKKGIVKQGSGVGL
jgi:hypothetical protein